MENHPDIGLMTSAATSAILGVYMMIVFDLLDYNHFVSNITNMAMGPSIVTNC